jgi:hypothetical protein
LNRRSGRLYIVPAFLGIALCLVALVALRYNEAADPN